MWLDRVTVLSPLSGGAVGCALLSLVESLAGLSAPEKLQAVFKIKQGYRLGCAGEWYCRLGSKLSGVTVKSSLLCGPGSYMSLLGRTAGLVPYCRMSTMAAGT